MGTFRLSRLEMAGLALLIGVSWVALFWLLSETHSPDVTEENRRVNVRWSEAFSEPERGRLERSFGLGQPEKREGTTWSYVVENPSRRVLRRIVQSRHVADTHGIDRDAYTLEGHPLPVLPIAMRSLLLSLLAGLVVLVALLYRRSERALERVGSTARRAGERLRERGAAAWSLSRRAVRATFRDHPEAAAWLLLSLVLFALSTAVLMAVAPEPPLPAIRIRWAPELTDAARGQIETHHALLEGEWQEGRTWSYRLGDRSPDNVRSLIERPEVEDTHGIDRSTGTLDRVPPGRELPWRKGLLTALLATGLLFGFRWIVAALGLERLRDAVLVCLVFAGASVLLLQTAELPNDHFMHLSLASRVLAGEVIQQDFRDVGLPLQVYLSALGQAVGGRVLLSEILLCTVAIAAGISLAAWLAYRLSGSWLLALGATALPLSLEIRLYNYPKLLVYPVAIWLIWRFLARPSWLSAVGMGSLAAVAFLFRHDHGVYLGIAIAVALGIAWWRSERPWRLSWVVAVTASGAFLTLPYLAHVHRHVGLVDYFRAGVRLSEREHARTSLQSLPELTIDMSAPLVATVPPSPPPRPVVNVYWQDELPADDRLELENRFSLLNGQPMSRTIDAAGGNPRRWAYGLADTSSQNVLALVSHPAVADTHGLDRTTGEVVAEARESLVDRLGRHVPALRMRVLPGILRSENVIPGLYYFFWIVSLAGLAVGTSRLWEGAKADSDAARAVVVGVTAVLLCSGFLRSGLAHRLADASIPIVVLAPWLAREALRVRVRKWFWRSVCVSLILLTALAVLARLERFERTRLLEGPTAVWKSIDSKIGEWSTSPPIDYWAPPGSDGIDGLTRYVYECTAPDDRWLVNWYGPEVFYFSERGFAGGQIVYGVGFFTTREDRVRRLSRLREQSIPVVALSDSNPDFYSEYPLVREWIENNYEPAASLRSRHGSIEVLVHRRWRPGGTYEWHDLPCLEAGDGEGAAAEGMSSGWFPLDEGARPIAYPDPPAASPLAR